MALFYDLSIIFWASLGFLGVSQGSWGILREALVGLGRAFAILGGPWWFLVCPLASLGAPRGSSGGPGGSSGRGQKGTKT